MGQSVRRSILRIRRSSILRLPIPAVLGPARLPAYEAPCLPGRRTGVGRLVAELVRTGSGGRVLGRMRYRMQYRMQYRLLARSLFG